MAKRKRRKRSKHQLEIINEDSDETFAFIAGYTSGGAPYGITWEEWEVQEEYNKSNNVSSYIDDQDLPF